MEQTTELIGIYRKYVSLLEQENERLRKLAGEKDRNINFGIKNLPEMKFYPVPKAEPSSPLIRLDGKKIKSQRLKLGMTIPELAELMDVSKGNIASWEADRWQPAEDKQERLTEALQCSLQDLQSDESLS